jgi:hypothetical protein
MMVRESDIQNAIRLALNPYAVIFRTNVGKVRMADGRWFDTGLPAGHTDLAGFRKSDGKAIYLEVKTPKGKLRDVQRHFIDAMQDYPVICGVVRSPEEAVEVVTES